MIRAMDALFACIERQAIRFVALCLCGLALAVGAFIARGCHIVGLEAQNQLVHKAP